MALMGTLMMVSGALSLSFLYRAAIQNTEERLAEMASSQARMIETFGKHVEEEMPLETNPLKATMHMLTNAHSKFVGIGRTGEFTLARRVGNQIEFLLPRRHQGGNQRQTISWNGTFAEPMRRALSGETGILRGLDYRGEKVLAAYEPVDFQNMGIVAKIDLSEVRAPFIKGAFVSLFVISFLASAGGLVFIYVVRPLRKAWEAKNEELEGMVAVRTQELLRSEQRYRQMFENNQAVKLVIDPANGSIVEANSSAAEYYGYDLSTLQSMNIAQINTYSPERIQLEMTAAKEEKRRYFLFPHRLASGEIRYVEVYSGPIHSDAKVLLLSIIHDITDRIEMEQQLRKAKEMADHANQSKTVYLANISHEIRSPLNNISGFAQILLQQMQGQAYPQEIKSYIQHIETGSKTLAELINNILDLAKIEAGKLELTPVELNLATLIQSVFHINKATARQKKIKFSYELDPNLPQVICADRTKLNQILMNLISNALKFTPKGKQVTLKVQKKQDRMVLMVEDQGIGIPQASLSRIFLPFEQADNTTAQSFGGTGLGLTLVKKLVELMQGTITVQSEPDQYTCFTVELPLVQGGQQLEGLAHESDWMTMDFGHRFLVWAVDDDSTSREMLRVCLSSVNLKVKLFESAVHALKEVETLADQNLPDVVLTDINMPSLSGLDFARKLQSMTRFADVPIIAISAEAFREQSEEALKNGVKVYLTKPLNLNLLIHAFSKYLHHAPSSVPGKTPTIQPLPAQKKKSLLNEFRVLERIPFYLTGELNEQITKMKVLCESYDSPYLNLLNQIDSAITLKNVDKVSELIRSVFSENLD